jgi:preprotein translocase subunit SecG
MFWVVVPIAILLSIVLIVMVLLQPSKGSGAGGAFGNLGASLGSTFGSRRTLDFLAKGTTWVAGALALICLLANIFLSSSDSGPSINPVTTGSNAAPNTPATPPPAAPVPGQVPAGQGQPAPAQQAPAEQGQPAPAQQTPAPTPNAGGNP